MISQQQRLKLLHVRVAYPSQGRQCLCPGSISKVRSSPQHPFNRFTAPKSDRFLLRRLDPLRGPDRSGLRYDLALESPQYIRGWCSTASVAT